MKALMAFKHALAALILTGLLVSGFLAGRETLAQEGMRQQVAQSEVAQGAPEEIDPVAASPQEVPPEEVVVPDEVFLDPAAPPMPNPAVLNGPEDKLTEQQQALRVIAEQDRGLVTLFFTEWQHTAIREARRSRGLVRPLSDQERDEIANRGATPEEALFVPPPPPEERNISLGGILYTKDGSWTIWLNGKRVTPKALPPQVLDLKVFKGHVDMKWVDAYTNQIYPIRLRPHQRFNLDTRIFLPG